MLHHEKADLTDRSLLRHKQLFIDGAWKTSSQHFDVIDPATGLVWAQAGDASELDVADAIKAAKRAFPVYSKMPPRVRAQRLLAFHNLVQVASDDLAQIVTLETGKPLAEAQGEVQYALSFVWWMCGEAERITGSTITSGVNPSIRYVTIKQAIGPVCLMQAWNFPVALLLRKLATALAAGCTVVVKPSPESPLSALALTVLSQRAGYEPGVINVLTCSLDNTSAVAELLCRSSDIKKISLTGSTRVGKLIMQQSASTLKKLTLELGGNGAWVVFDDADLEQAVKALMASKWRASGQACITANRIYLQRGISARFIESFARAMQEQLHLGAGLDRGSTIGPLTTPQSVERAKKHVEDAVQRGAKILLGGKVPPGKTGGYWFEPTLLVDVSKDALVFREETFSPIAAFASFETEEEVTRWVNDTEHGLTNYCFTRDLSRAWRCLERFESGTVSINTSNPTAAETPFGGVKASGLGKEAGIGDGINEFLVTKTGAMTLDI